ncbi:MAG: DinB family protein [Candidatus Kariarchaeaceae archaeon]|jgi:hypothetical protein
MAIKEELRGYLDKSMDKFENIVNNLKEEDLSVQIQDKENGWTVIEILRHIQNSERGMTGTIKSVLEGGEGAPEDFDLKRYNSRTLEKMQDLTLDQIKSNMINYRKRTLEVLESVKESDWEKTGRHATLDIFSIKRFFEIISWHQRHHLKAISEKFSL